MSVPMIEKTSISKTERASISETKKASNTTAAVLPESVVTRVPAPDITNKTEAISPPRSQGSVMKAAKMFEEASGFTSTRKLSSTSTDETFTGVTEAVDRVSATVVVDKPTPIVVGGMSSEDRTSVTSPTRSTFPNTGSDIASSAAEPSKTPAALPVPVNAANVSSPVNIVNTSAIPVSAVASAGVGKLTSSEPVPVVAVSQQ
jgi:metal-dependent amidase/aminoacylase/carboxypeptidase family protein